MTIPGLPIPSKQGVEAATLGALVSLVFGPVKTSIGHPLGMTDLQGKEVLFDVVQLDANVQEVHTTSASVTEHPVESGANVADHIRRDPEELQIDGIISNTPVMIGASVFCSATRAEEEYGKLRELMDANKPVIVSTSKGDFEDMVITRLQRKRSASIGDSVEVSITMRKIHIVESATVGAPKHPRAKKKLGPKPKAPANASQSASLLAKLLGV